MAVDAVVGIFKAETALESKASVFIAAHAYPRRMHALVQPDHVGGGARITSELLRVFGCRTRGVPVREGGSAGDHQQDQGRHAGNVAASDGLCKAFEVPGCWFLVLGKTNNQQPL